MNFSHLQKKAAQEIIATTLHKIETDQMVSARSWQDLFADISLPAKQLARQITEIDPSEYGIKRSPVQPDSPDNLVAISNQTYRTRDGEHTIPSRLATESSHYAFTAMNRKMYADIDRELVIQSGFRSPAYQLFVFLFQLQENSWNFPRTIKRVALPGNSEHATKEHALDLRAKEFLGPHDSYEFKRTAEFRWLKENAEEFGFSMSYPKKNGTNTQFEPWHWRHSHPSVV